jgi:hypothetical protein
MSDIRTRIEQVESGQVCDTVSGVLDEATEDDVDALKPILPDLLSHTEWVVRASAVELIGVFRLRRFLNLVTASLEDRNAIVRGYALSAYYDLLGEKALPLLRNWCDARDVRNRVDALALCYVETRQAPILDKLRRILMNKRCHFRHRYVAMNTFGYYLDVGKHPEMVKLFQDIRRRLRDAPRSFGLDKDIPRMLRKWTQSGRTKKK